MHLAVLLRSPIIMRMIAISTLSLGSVLTATAQESENESGSELESERGSSWSLGIAAISSQKPFKDIDRDNKVIPLIFYEGKYVELVGAGIEFKLANLELSESQQFSFRAVTQYSFGGYDEDEADETPILNGMDERKGGFWAGAKIEWRNPLVDVSAEWLSDISGNSEGQQFNLGLERTWVFGQRLILTPRVVASWQDDKYVDYHYGVRTHEVRVDRPVFIGESAVNIEYGLRGIYMFDRHNALFLDLGATSLAQEIKDSPLVDSSTESRMIVGYRYQF